MIHEKLQGAKILLVEDDEINQDIALELLRSNGLIVTLAVNGEDALACLKEDTFDAVLMDCQMPVMDGHEATIQIRKIEKYKNLPILAMTANAMSEDRDKALASGMNDHISKPINVKLMFEVIGKWILNDNKKNGGQLRE